MLFVSLAQRVRLSDQSRSNRTVQPQALLPVHTGGMTDHGAENGTSSARGWEVPGGSPTLEVTYSGRHMFGLGAVKATFTIASSELLVADPVAASTVVVSVYAGSFRSDKSRRDDQVRSASLLDAATYPNITFTSDGLREQGAGWVLDGALTAHGQTV